MNWLHSEWRLPNGIAFGARVTPRGRGADLELCPCVYSDPVLPDAEPGQRVSTQGRIRFCEGPESRSKKERLLDEMEHL